MGGVGGRCKKGLPAQVGSQGKHRNTQVRAVVGDGSGGEHLDETAATGLHDWPTANSLKCVIAAWCLPCDFIESSGLLV